MGDLFFVFGRKSCTSKVYYYLCTTKQGRCLVFVLSRRDGSLAKWLGTGLQNRLRRFDSATNLTKRSTMPLYLERHLCSFFFMGGKAYSSSPHTFSLSMQRAANVLLMYRDCGNREVGGCLLCKVIGKSTNFAGNF